MLAAELAVEGCGVVPCSNALNPAATAQAATVRQSCRFRHHGGSATPRVGVLPMEVMPALLVMSVPASRQGQRCEFPVDQFTAFKIEPHHLP